MVWVERTIQYDQQIKIRFGNKVYTTTWGEFGKLIKRTVKRVLPPDFRIAGVASSKSSESQYYWVLTGNRCFSFRISNHRPLKGLPTTQQENFITRYYQDFGELESALTAYFSRPDRQMKLDFQHFLILALIRAAEWDYYGIFLEQNQLVAYDSDEKRMGIKVPISQEICRRIKALIKLGLVVNGDDPHYAERVGLDLTHGGRSILNQYEQVSAAIFLDKVPVLLLDLDFKALRQLVLHPEKTSNTTVIAPLLETVLLVQLVCRVSDTSYLTENTFRYQYQGQQFDIQDKQLLGLMRQTVDYGLLDWYEDDHLVTSDYGHHFLGSFHKNYPQLVINHSELPRFPIVFSQLNVEMLVSALTNPETLAAIKVKAYHSGLKQLHKQFVKSKQPCAQACADYLRSRKLYEYDGDPRILRDLIVIVYGKYDEARLIKRDEQGHVLWNGYQVYGKAIKRAVVHSKRGQQLFRSFKRSAAWREDQRQVLVVHLR